MKLGWDFDATETFSADVSVWELVLDLHRGCGQLVNSFVMRSPISWHMVVPLENTTLTYKFLRMSKSHFVMHFKVDLSSVS